MSTKRFFVTGLIVISVLTLAILFVQPTHAASLTVTTISDDIDENDGLCSLREAVIAANTNMPSGLADGECPAGSDIETDVITLVDGETYTFSIPGVDEYASETGDLNVINNSAELDLQIVVTNNGFATIDADALDRGLYIDSAAVEINGVTLMNGDVNASVLPSGGVILNNDGSLTMNGGVIRSGSAETGGGLYNYSSESSGGQAILNGTQVILNDALVYGGGIISGGTHAHLVLNDSQVRANTTPGLGAGIALLGGTTEVISSSITLNVADDNGGGIIIEGAILTITQSLIEGNQALSGSGGGLFLVDETSVLYLALTDTTFSSNSAGYDGGGIFQSTTESLELNSVDFYSNEAGDQGGAVYSSYAEVSGGTFDGNQAVYGGAIYGGIELVLNDAAFTNNSALNGGALYSQFLNAAHITLVGNSADDYGGGAYVSNTYLNLVDSTIVDNFADLDGGGIYQEDGVLVGVDNLITGSLFFQNTASGDGGAFWAGEYMHFVNSTFAENEALGFGGGVYVTNSTAVLTSTNVTFAANQAINGSAIFTYGDFWLQNTLFGTHPSTACELGNPTGNLISLGHNLSETGDCELIAIGDLPNTPAGLTGSVQDNGGPTWTWALSSSSNAVNAGDDTACAGSFVNGVDQRGFSRLSPCDIGAYEMFLQVFLPLIIK